MDFAAQITRTPIAHDKARADEARDLFGGLDERIRDLLAGTAGCSPYLWSLMVKEKDWLPAAFSAGDDLAARETEGFGELSESELGPALRQAKRRVALLAGLADLGGVWRLEQVTGALTELADRATDLALRCHLAREIARGKLPDTDAEAGGIFAMAMGKQGAGELNYSSDIDLIVLFDDAAYDAADRHEARASLIRVTRRMAATLSDNTEHGYVFRTDLRLRPDAAVTPVCLSAAAALAYYEAEGRTWERAAYIKARPCAGDIAAGERFLADLRPFVWRKHLDFAAIQDAHDMRLRIRDHKGLGGRLSIPGHNMKLGQGGIREIEFFTQTRQLIAGGRDPDLRLRGTVDALAALAAKDWIPQDIADELTSHYRQHRDIEHRIQMVNDAQTHELPKDREGLENIALMMGESDLDSWSTTLRERLEKVEKLTNAFFSPADTAPLPELSEEAQKIIQRWDGYPALRTDRAQQIFRRIKPDLLARMNRAAYPEEALSRFDSFLQGMPAGVQLFSLFEANPSLIDLLVDICATAPGLAAYLGRHPAVLDAVLAGSFFAPWPGREALEQDLSRRLQQRMKARDGGYERALDEARLWAHEWQFRVGVHHLRGLSDAAQVGKEYADIADSAITALLPLVADELAERHGPPPGRGAVVMGMGSLGARRLNAASDLDLLVIYDAAGAEESAGRKPLGPRAWYSRLTQALITALSAQTATGRLYEVDMRLRPSGRQGPVATSLESFRNYQMTEAWTWEHLALTRARIISACGDDASALADEVEAFRAEVLAERGGDARVLPDLAEMRSRIFAAKAPDGKWEAKIGRGRLQDIELIGQSFALRAADPARGLEAQLRAGGRHDLLAKEDAEALQSGQRFLWRLQAGGRLISEAALKMDELGAGGQEFLLRETDCEDLEELETRLNDVIETAGNIIDRLLSDVSGTQPEAQ
ncbi:glutamine-synthetase adenylyltransferase [Paracoccus aerodenitrificans]|uniref:[protein-PII] uridylyltransferase family protein n=1 Tax=Paracoccus aerodenitrificans TaxID=3017781 RepID=UPI0022F044B3|nr:glutamine-synthetase adenylyltransferase [Paracoccus aerodenitrificans]WBU64420.1 glutamine-synthetase adenylyltransferase [Paracoccus aerodenitrificans]